MVGRALKVVLIGLLACGDGGDAPPVPAETVRSEAPEGCVPAASPSVGDLPGDVVLQWARIVDGRADAWRVRGDGQFEWTYGHRLPLPAATYPDWHEGPPLPAEDVARLRLLLAERMPTLVSFEPERTGLHTPGRRGYDAPGVGSAWYTGECGDVRFVELAQEVDRILDADGRPRTKIRERGRPRE